MSEQIADVESTNPTKKKGNNIKLIIGGAILVVVAALIIWRVLFYFTVEVNNQYIKLLVDYYASVADNKQEDTQKLILASFIPGPEVRLVKPGNYNIFIYKVDSVTATSNASESTGKMVFYSITIKEGGNTKSYLNEAFVDNSNNQLKLAEIVNQYVGQSALNN